MKSDPEGGSMKPAPLLFSTRLTLFIVFMVSTFTFLIQRLNVSFAFVCMVKIPNNTLSVEGDLLHNVTETLMTTLTNGTTFGNKLDEATEEDDVCRLMAADRANSSSSNPLDDGEFEWSKEEQGAILAAFFYGYLFTQVFGGWLAERFGAKPAFLGSIFSLSILTLINPVAARYGPGYMSGIRFLQGFTHGASLPAINTFGARWCSPQERGFLMGLAYGGFCIAAATTFPICAFLCRNFGWESIFYATGGFGMIFLIISYFLVYEWPENHPRISKEELEYLRKTRAVSYSSSQKSKKINVPWRKIVFSGPINVIHITHTCFTWGFLMVGFYMPTFMREVLYMDTSKNGLYSSLPYVGMLVVHFTIGPFFDFLRKREFCSVSTLRKIFNTVGMTGPAFSMIITGFLSCTNIEYGIAMVTAGQTLAEFAFMGGYLLSIFELAPQYAGIILGITNTFGVLPGFLCPLFVSLMTQNGTRQEWVIAFSVGAALNLIGAVLYVFFGSSDLQSWAVGNERRASSISGPLSARNGSNQNENMKNGNGFKEQEMVPLNIKET